MAKTKHSTPLRKHDTNDHMGAGALTYEGEEIQKRPDPKTHKETIGKYKLNTWTSPNTDNFLSGFGEEISKNLKFVFTRNTHHNNSITK